MKAIVFGALVVAGVVKPFVGDNAETYYIPISQRMLHEGRFNGPDSRPDSKMPPGYPLVLAAASAISQRHALIIASWLQMLADLAVALTLYGLGGLIVSRAAGFWAGLAWLLFPPAVAISTWITAETFFTAAVTGSIALLLLSTRGKVAYALAAGLLMGVATLFRATTVALPLFLLPLWFRRDISKRFAKALAFTASAYCVILCWTVRNHVVLNDRIPVGVSFGAAVLQGSDARTFTIEGKRRLYPEMVRSAAEDGIAKPVTEKESEIDHYLLRVGLHNYQVAFAHRPLALVKFLAYKSVRLWYGTESGGAKQQLVLALCSLAVVPLALLQLWRWLRNGSVAGPVFLLTLAYFVLLHVAVVPEYRYVQPIFPLLLLAAAEFVLKTRRPDLETPDASLRHA